MIQPTTIYWMTIGDIVITLCERLRFLHAHFLGLFIHVVAPSLMIHGCLSNLYILLNFCSKLLNKNGV